MSDLPVDAVQCQRTRLFLETKGSPTVQCPWCPEEEIYVRLAPENEPARHVGAASRLCREVFAVEEDDWPTIVWLGNSPETVFEEGMGRFHIYLDRGANPLQHAYSGAHEAFHRVCGEGKNASHWADEMFAVLFSLTYLETTGEHSHAEANRLHLRQEAALCSIDQAIRTAGGDGIYGRVFLIGEGLIGLLGWDAVKPLAAMRLPDGTCDVERWLATLGGQRLPVEEALGTI